MKDNAGRFIAVNGAFAARFGGEQEAVVGKTKTDLFGEEGAAELHKTRIDLDSLVAEVVRELQADLSGRAVEWRIGALPEMCADRSLLRLALVNLIGNALKYTGKREVPVIEIGCMDGGAARPAVYIRDNGVGFDMKHAHRLFGVFSVCITSANSTAPA